MKKQAYFIFWNSHKGHRCIGHHIYHWKILLKRICVLHMEKLFQVCLHCLISAKWALSMRKRSGSPLEPCPLRWMGKHSDIKYRGRHLHMGIHSQEPFIDFSTLLIHNNSYHSKLSLPPLFTNTKRVCYPYLPIRNFC